MSGLWGFVKRHLLTVYAALAIGYMLLPIAVVFVFSFNQPAGRFNYVWQQFTFDNWIDWNGPPGIQDALVTSILIAVLGKMRPLGVGVASVLVAVLMVGSDSLQRSVGLPASAGFVFQAIVVLCVLFVDARRAAGTGA